MNVLSVLSHKLHEDHVYRSDGRIIDPGLVEEVYEYMDDWFENMDTGKSITMEESLRGWCICFKVP